MGEGCLLGIDIGTMGVKAGIFSEDAQLQSRRYLEYQVSMPRPGWFEQDPHIWWNATVNCLKE
ncbi:MAG: xylulokinase, partial [Nitrososphaeria archaeon]|nr:xylulokinase [Nitrososphaeria archaeon]